MEKNTAISSHIVTPILETRITALSSEIQKTDLTSLSILHALGYPISTEDWMQVQSNLFTLAFDDLIQNPDPLEDPEEPGQLPKQILHSLRAGVLSCFAVCTAEETRWTTGLIIPMEQTILDVIQEFDPALAL